MGSLTKEVVMDYRQSNHLNTGALFVAPGQIMYPGIATLPRYPSHVSRLRSDVGLDLLEAEPEQEQPAPTPGRLRRWFGQLFRRRVSGQEVPMPMGLRV
jgi:hypothetical protein